MKSLELPERSLLLTQSLDLMSPHLSGCLVPQQELRRIDFSRSLSLIWTIYSFSFLTWLTARYEKQPVVTVKNTFFTISLAAAT